MTDEGSGLLQIIRPEGWPMPRGYSNAVLARGGRWLFIAGQIGWDEQERIVSDDLAAQVRQALKNTATLLAAAGGRPEHIVRMTWYILDREECLRCQAGIGAAYREFMGRHYPAMSMVQVSGLMEARARVEIESTALLPDG